MKQRDDMVVECAIVGGGVIGLSIAYELLHRKIDCVLVDQGPIGKGCSWAGAGILPPARLDTACDPIDELRGLSHQLHPQWAERLRKETGIDNGYRRCGGVYLATSAGEAAALLGQASFWEEYGIESTQLSLAELLQKEPAISKSFTERHCRTAWWAPDEAQIRPPDHLRALRTACESLGCQFREFSTVVSLQPINANESPLDSSPISSLALSRDAEDSARQWQVICEVATGRREPIRAKRVVFACGAWASRFADPAIRTGDVFPVRGQAILFQANPGLLNSVINEGHRYLVPREDGVIYVGSNEEEVGLTEGTTPEVIESLKNWAFQWVPALAKLPVIRTISGLRPGSMDGFPHLGPSPNHPGIYIATGHFRSGLHLSCATAVVMADIITGQSPKLKSLPLTAAR